METMNEPAHAIISPSSFFRARHCIGSVWDGQSVPDTVTSYAQDGIDIHEWSATALRLALNGKQYIPTIEKLEEGWKRDMSMNYVEFVLSLVARIRTIADKSPRVFVEERVSLSELTWGTLDLGIVFEKDGKSYVIIADLKTGTGHAVYAQDPETDEINSQLGLYAAMFCKTKGIEPEKVWLYIYQPTIHEPGFDKAEATLEELTTLVEEAGAVEEKWQELVQIGKPTAEHYKAGEWCNKFCKVLATCAHYRNHVKKTSLSNLDELAPAKIDRQLSVPTDTSKLLQIYAVKSQIEDWLSQVEHELMNRLQNGDEKASELYKLVHSRPHPKWNDDQERVAAYLKKCGIKNPYKKELINITEARRLLKKDKDLVDKALTYSPPKVQIAKISDPRQAISTRKDSLKELGELTDESKRNSGAGSKGKRGDRKGKAGRKGKDAKRSA